MRSFLTGVCLSALPAALAGQSAPVVSGDTTGFVVQAIRFMADGMLRNKRLAVDSVVAIDIVKEGRVHSPARLLEIRRAHASVVRYASFSATIDACRRAANQCAFPGFDVVVKTGLPRAFGDAIAVAISYSEVGEDRGAPDAPPGGTQLIRRAYFYAGLIIFAKDSRGMWHAVRYFPTEFG